MAWPYNQAQIRAPIWRSPAILSRHVVPVQCPTPLPPSAFRRQSRQRPAPWSIAIGSRYQRLDSDTSLSFEARVVHYLGLASLVCCAAPEVASGRLRQLLGPGRRSRSVEPRSPNVCFSARSPARRHYVALICIEPHRSPGQCRGRDAPVSAPRRTGGLARPSPLAPSFIGTETRRAGSPRVRCLAAPRPNRGGFLNPTWRSDDIGLVFAPPRFGFRCPGSAARLRPALRVCSSLSVVRSSDSVVVGPAGVVLAVPLSSFSAWCVSSTSVGPA